MKGREEGRRGVREERESREEYEEEGGTSGGAQFELSVLSISSRARRDPARDLSSPQA